MSPIQFLAPLQSNSNFSLSTVSAFSLSSINSFLASLTSEHIFINSVEISSSPNVLKVSASNIELSEGYYFDGWLDLSHNYQGSWSAGVAYKPSSIVAHSSATWFWNFSANSIAGVEPGSGTGENVDKWVLFGKTGTDVIDGGGSGGGTGTVTKATSSIGDGSSTSIIYSHNLGSSSLNVNVWDNNTGDLVFTSTQIVNLSAIKFDFTVAPTIGQYRVVVMS